MRKKTMNNLFDNIMWYLIYMLPLFCFLFLLIRTGSVQTLSTCMSSLGLGVLETSDITTTLTSIFGVGGIVPLFANTDIILYMSYFVCVFVLHLAVDFLLFIPRLAHKWLNKLCGGDN